MACAAALILGGGMASAQAQRQRGSASRSVLGASDQRFMESAYRDGATEVELGKLGVQKATNPKVKDFAQKLVDDHTKLNTELESLAKQKGVTLTMPQSKSATETRLDKMSGAAFDKAFMHNMVMDHEKAISLYETEAKSGTDNDVKEFASKYLPELKSHLDTAKQIQP
jgi:putative membrane protein